MKIENDQMNGHMNLTEKDKDIPTQNVYTSSFLKICR